MTSWTSFVGQVARLRRLFARVFVRATRRHAHDADEPLVVEEAFVAEEEPRAGGPPAHWVERVRRGAPGLLEPSFRSLGEPVRPTADDFAPPEAETEVEPQPVAPETAAPERDGAPAEPAVVRQPPAPRARTTPSQRVSSLRKVVRRMRISAASRTAAVDGPPPSASDAAPVEASTATNPEPPPESSPVAELPEHPRAADENRPTPVRAARPAPDEAEPPPQRTTVVEFDAPRIPRRTVRAERSVRDDAVTPRAAAPDATQNSAVERPFDDGVARHARERVVTAPAPRRATDVLRAPEPTPQRTLAPVQPSFEAAPPLRSRNDPLPTRDDNVWPELPPPLDEADSDVDATVRAWERQRRLDREQTRL